MANSQKSSKKIEEQSVGDLNQQTVLSVFEYASVVNRALNAVGVLGSLMTIWQFVLALTRIRNSETGAGLYLDSFVIVFFFIIFISLSGYKIPRHNIFYTVMSACFALIFSLILIATYYVASGVILSNDQNVFIGEHLARIFIRVDGELTFSFIDFLELVFSSSIILALFMFFSAYLGANYFLAKSKPFVSRLATVPMVCFFLWLLYFLLFRGVLALEFQDGVRDIKALTYGLVTLMTLSLVAFVARALRRSEKLDPQNLPQPVSDGAEGIDET